MATRARVVRVALQEIRIQLSDRGQSVADKAGAFVRFRFPVSDRGC